MHRCNAIMHDGAQVTQDKWGAETVALMRDFYTSRFVVRANEGHKDKTNDKVLEFLPISGEGLVRCKKYDGDRQHIGRIGLLRQLVKSLDCEEVLVDAQTREGVFNHIEQILRRDGLHSYFRGMVGEYFEPWCDYMRQQAGGLQAYEGRYDILRESDSGKGLQPNTSFDEHPEHHDELQVYLPETITNYKCKSGGQSDYHLFINPLKN